MSATHTPERKRDTTEAPASRRQATPAAEGSGGVQEPRENALARNDQADTTANPPNPPPSQAIGEIDDDVHGDDDEAHGDANAAGTTAQTVEEVARNIRRHLADPVYAEHAQQRGPYPQGVEEAMKGWAHSAIYLVVSPVASRSAPRSAD